MTSPRDFIDVYLAEIQNKRSENFDIEQLVVICLDFFQVFSTKNSSVCQGGWVVIKASLCHSALVLLKMKPLNFK